MRATHSVLFSCFSYRQCSLLAFSYRQSRLIGEPVCLRSALNQFTPGLIHCVCVWLTDCCWVTWGAQHASESLGDLSAPVSPFLTQQLRQPSQHCLPSYRRAVTYRGGLLSFIYPTDQTITTPLLATFLLQCTVGCLPAPAPILHRAAGRQADRVGVWGVDTMTKD